MLPTLAALALAAGCGPGDRPRVPDRANTLVVAVERDVENLSGVHSMSSNEDVVNAALYYPLVDVGFDCAVEYRPGIATRWAWSEDGRVLSMWLRDDIRFHDGAPLTAHDVAFTWDLAGDPAVGSPWVDHLEQMVPGRRPLVVDAHHLEWHFLTAYDQTAQLAHASSIPVLPRHLLGEVDRAALRAHPFGLSPTGSGPWRVAAHDPGSRLVLEPSPGFTGPPAWRPRLDRVVFRVIPDYATRELELRGGGVDHLDRLTVATADALRRERPDLRIARRGWRAMDYVAWNLERPLFQDTRVRRALALAVDVDGMIARLLTSETGEVYGRRAVGTITPALCGVHADEIIPLPHDPAAAAALLAEAGWADTDGDGVLDQGASRLSFHLLVNTGNSRREDSAVLLQHHLAEVGVEVHIETVETNALYERLGNRDYDAALGGWSAALYVDPANVWQCSTPEAPRERNYTGYCSTEADAHIAAGLAEPDPAAAAVHWRALQRRLYEDQPYLFLFWMDELVAVDDRFQDATINLLSPLRDLHRWSLRQDFVPEP